MKRLSAISLVLVLVLSLVGCGQSEELKLYKAFEKTLDINSMESNTEVSITVEGKGLNEENKIMLDQAKKTLNDSKFYINQKQSLNQEGTKGKAKVDLSADLGGVKSDINVWVDMDYTSKKPKLVEIIKMPKMLMSEYGPVTEGKDYIVYDIGEMINEEELDMDFSKLMNLSKDLQPKMEEFMKNSFKDFKLDGDIVTNSGKKVVDGKVLSIYTAKLDDQSFKNLLRSSVNYSLENKDSIEFFKEYMSIVSSAVEISSPTDQISKEELDKELNELEGKLPELKSEFNKFMDSIDDVKIIGDKGIVIEYGIDSHGFIVSEKGNLDLRIDLAKVQEESSITGVINVGINYNSNIKNINKDLKIDLPEVNDTNSIDIMKLMDIQLEQMEETK